MEIIDPDGMLTEGRLASGEQPQDRFADPAYRQLVEDAMAGAYGDVLKAAPRVTWEDIEAVYPDIPPAELRQQLAEYGYNEFSLGDLLFEVVTKGSWARWSNARQRFEQADTPDFWPFTQGGILVIIAGSTREPFGMGRKTSKWFVATEVFQTYAEALARSEEVKAAPPKGNGDPADYAQLWERR